MLSWVIIGSGCDRKSNEGTSQIQADDSVHEHGELVDLPEPSKSNTNYCKVIGWPEGKTPVSPAGFEVTKFARGIKSPRSIYVAPNGDVFVALSNTESKGVKKVIDAIEGKAKSQPTGKSANQILLFKNGKPENPISFLSGLNQPFGMLILNNYFYVANTDGLWRYPYKEGQADMPPSAWVYILTNGRHTTLYVGCTNDLPTRLWEHRTKQNPKSFTARYNVSKLVYYEPFELIVDAIEREKFMKGKSRKWQEGLIIGMNPEWRDLTEEIMQCYR